MKLFFLSFFLIFFIAVSKGQTDNENLLRKKEIIIDKNDIKINDFSIQPDNFKIYNKQKLISETEYKIDYEKAVLHFYDFKKFKNLSLTIYFFVFPEIFRKTYQTYQKPEKKTDTLLLPALKNDNIYTIKPFSGLETKGNITRGINVGNRQSLVMISGLDLKMEGKLSDKIRLKAVLNDDNLPQAYAGISKSYKDFNRIYMQLSGQSWQITGGDIIMDKNQSNFLHFKRKTQGIDFSVINEKQELAISGGIVDGTYNRMQFNGIEGNRGPYLLKGKRGETYIFVVAGSEKVYIDGELMQNGKDYKINYETGELIFDNKILITPNEQISVEFNYSNQNYLRYLNYNSYKRKFNKTEFQIYTYLEQDNKQKTLLYNLTSEQIKILKNAGDNPDNLMILSAKESSYNPDKILYKKIMNGNSFYFKYTVLEEPDLYEVRFSYVGKNRGSYDIDKIISTGKIYKYVGELQGDYEPLIKLISPKSKQYAGVKFKTSIGKKSNLFSEILMNYTDKNLFSKLDDRDNIGMAGHFYFDTAIKNDSTKQWKIFGKYNFVHRNFLAIDPYYDTEYTVRWQIDSIFGKQHLLDIGSSYSINNNSFVKTGLRYYQVRDTIMAKQIYLEGNVKLKKIYLEGENRFTSQTIPQGSLELTDTENLFQIPIKKWKWNNTFHFEKREKKIRNEQDTLNYLYKFLEMEFIKKDSVKLGLKTGFRIEQNDSIRNNLFVTANRNYTAFLQLVKQYKTGRIDLFNRFRKTNYFFENRSREFINMELHWKQFYYKKIFTQKIAVETSSGNILQDEVLFVETPPGQGNYQWNDYNENGIKEINEFEFAVFSDQANYIRIILPSKNLIPTQKNRYMFHLAINPSIAVKNKFAKKFYDVLHLETTHQIKQTGDFKIFFWQPKNFLLENIKLQNDLFFNRTKKKYFIHFGLQKRKEEQVLLIGKQSMQTERIFLETKHQFNNLLKWTQKISSITNIQTSENYTAKNFIIKNNELEEAIHFFKVKKYDMKLYYRFKKKLNLSGTESLIMNKAGIEYNGFSQKKYNFQGRLSFVYNRFSGSPQTPVAFQMLEGLQKGRNFIFELNYRQRLNSYLDMYLNYNFRTSQNNPVIHTGGIQLKMFF